MTVVRDFAMYTVDGNHEVGVIAECAIQSGKDWAWALSELESLSKQEEYSEAMDTEVRAALYSFVGFKTPFYL
jgi:hypothetical protein